MNPEERARKEIDRYLRESGWAVQDYPEMNIYATTGVAVREFPLRMGHGTVDYRRSGRRSGEAFLRTAV